VAEVAKPATATKPAAAAKPMSAAPRRGFAIPTIAIGVVALVLVFAGQKLIHRSPEASTEPMASVVEQPEARPKAQQIKAPQPAESVGATRSEASGVQPVIVAPTPKPVAKGAAGEIARGAVAHQALPNVPQNALNTIQGAVRVGVRVQVDAAGKVVGADLDSAGPSKYFAGLAMKAARDWQFTPPKVDGQNASSEWILRFEFAQDGTKATAIQKVPLGNL